MRYIRTKDGRIVDLKRTVFDSKLIHLDENQIDDGNWAGWYWKIDEYGYEIECRDVDILEQADTIAELCDEFVYSDNVFKNVIYENYSALKILLKIRKNYIVFGAIWTDKGLIYVAKMNDKGELELL